MIQDTGILKQGDRASVFGQNWDFHTNGTRWGGASSLDLPGGNQAKSSYFCQLDRLKDDGVHDTGDYRAVSGTTYDLDTDCWSLNGRANVVIKLDY